MGSTSSSTSIPSSSTPRRARPGIARPRSNRSRHAEEAMTSAHQTMRDLAEPARELRAEIPEVIDGYATTQRAVMVDGALPAKVKELIALAISATRQCDGCIASHARRVAGQHA